MLRLSLMRYIVHYTLLILIIIFGPRWLGLVGPSSSILAHALWGAFFGAVGGVFLRILFHNVFRN